MLMRKQITRRAIGLLAAVCLLLSAMPLLPGAVELSEVNIYGPETFDGWSAGERQAPWSASGTSGGLSAAQPDPDGGSGMVYQLKREKATGGLNASYTMDKPVTAGTVGFAFKLKLRGTERAGFDFFLRDSANKQIAVYTLTVGSNITMRDPSSKKFEVIPGTEDIKFLPTDDFVTVKITVCADEGAQSITTQIGDAAPFVQNGFYDAAGKDFNFVVFQSQANAANVGASVNIDDFRVFRMEEVRPDDEIVQEEAAKIDLGDLELLDHHLTLPTEGANGTTIEWTSSDERVITNTGLITQAAEVTYATLTATVRKNDASASRDFPLSVAADLTRGPLNWVAHDTFESAVVPDGWTTSGGYVQDNKLIVPKLDSNGVSATRTFSYPVNGDLVIEHEYMLNASSGGKALQENIRGTNEAGDITTLFMIRYMQDNSLAYRAVENGSPKYYYLGEGNGKKYVSKGELHTIRFRINLYDQRLDVSVDGEMLLENVPFMEPANKITKLVNCYWTTASADFPTHIEIGNFKIGTRENYKQIVESDLAAITIVSQDGLTENFMLPLDGSAGSKFMWESDNDAVSIDTAGFATVTRPPADGEDIHLNLKASAVYETYSDEKIFPVTVRRSLSIKEELEEASGSLNTGVILGKNQDADHILSNLNLITSWKNGTSVSWSSPVNCIEISGTTGKVNGNLLEETETSKQVTLTATISKAGQSVTKDIVLTVLNPGYINLASGMKTRASAELTTNLSNMAVDDKVQTPWIAPAGDKNPYLVIDLGKETTINRFQIIQKNAVVNSYKIEMSQNGQNWSAILEDTRGGEGVAVDLVLDEPVKTKYLRYYVTSKEAGETGLYEFRAYMRYNDGTRVWEDLQSIQLPASTTADLTLPFRGANGSTISWTSSAEDSISSAGRVTQQDSTKTVTLTAEGTLNGIDKTRTFTVKVPGKGSGGGGSGGRGGGGSNIGGQRNEDVVMPVVPTNPEQPRAMFDDVPNGHWAKAYVEELAEKGIIKGVSDTRFEPDRSITRAEFVTLLVNTFGFRTADNDFQFVDVQEGQWYAEAVAGAVVNGIANGMGENYFGAQEAIRRQDMAVMLVNAVQASGKSLENTGASITFSDGGAIAAYAAESVRLLAENKILSGTPDGAFQPERSATRAEVAKVLSVLLETIR